MGNQMKMKHLENVQPLETSIETGNLQSYDEQSIGQPKGQIDLNNHCNQFTSLSSN